MTTNIVLLAKNRPELTFQVITTLYRHTINADFTLTIIDDESSFPLVDWEYPKLGSMRYGLKHSNLTILRVEKSKGITGQVRNLGIYWTEKFFGRGGYLYLSDSDVAFTEGWLDTLIHVYEASCDDPWNIRLLGGSTHPFHGINETIQVPTMPETEIHTHDAVSGYSHLMRWETWDKFGPHDAHAKGIRQSEDWKFCQDIIKDGGKVGTVWPEVVYATGLTDTFGNPSIGADRMPRYEGILQQ